MQIKPRHWLYGFLMVVAGYFIGMAGDIYWLRLICKPLLLMSLLGYLLQVTKYIRNPIKPPLALALIFSALGDSFLLFEAAQPIYFILGLLAFLIAHGCYILSFHRMIRHSGLSIHWPPAIPVVIYYGWLNSLLLPSLGALKIPVLVYGAVICFMLYLAIQLYQLKDHRTGQFLLTGALLFVVSDSILAYTKFSHPLPGSGWLVMSSYVLAQWLLVQGCCRYLLAAGSTSSQTVNS